jgi:hypothetical protein
MFCSLAKQAVADTNKVLKKSKLLQMAFVKYAKGTDRLEKRAQMEKEMKKMAQQAAPTLKTNPNTLACVFAFE